MFIFQIICWLWSELMVWFQTSESPPTSLFQWKHELCEGSRLKTSSRCARAENKHGDKHRGDKPAEQHPIRPECRRASGSSRSPYLPLLQTHTTKYTTDFLSRPQTSDITAWPEIIRSNTHKNVRQQTKRAVNYYIIYIRLTFLINRYELVHNDPSLY